MTGVVNGDSPAEGTVPAVPAEPPKLPGYLQIMQNAFARGGSENDDVTFTLNEIISLANDPDFARFYPGQSAQMRAILQKINSS